MSTRTLQRRLASEGTSFRALVDQERVGAARAFLALPDLGADEIADRLGYSEASAFVRAFRRWTGTTPGEYRQASERAQLDRALG